MIKNLLLILVRFVSSQNFVKKEINQKAKKIINLYVKKGFIKEFVTLRFWFGPVHELNNLIPEKGTILELGCGEGIVSNFLALNGAKRKITGLELVSERVEEANLNIKNIKFRQGNILKSDLPKTDIIVLSHVLHHLPSYKDQELAIKRCYEALHNNGSIYIAEVNKNVSLKYLFGWLVDVIAVPIFFEHRFINFNVFHRNFVEWIQILNNAGFSITKMEFIKKRPYPEVIFVATKRDL